MTTPNRFRFRAWDKTNKHMTDRFSLDCQTGEPLQFRAGGPTLAPMTVILDDHILMQSTGLADRNGKEIFEGDVLRETCGVFVPQYVNRVVKWEIESKDEDDNHIRAGFYLPDHRIERFEIIGNIHQHPELLK
jgi:uncharacterized phage protein (TIGR01671 family)